MLLTCHVTGTAPQPPELMSLCLYVVWVQCRVTLKKAPGARLPMNFRTWAAIIYTLSVFSAFPNLTIPQLWHSWPESNQLAGSLKDHALYRDARRWGLKFLAGEPLKDSSRKHKVPKIPREVALKASQYLKVGHWEFVPATKTRQPQFVHRYYNTVQQACQLCPELQAIRNQYELSNKQFLAAMHAADPNLRRRKVRMKYALNEKEMFERKDRARVLLNRCNQDPTFLDRVFFVDECAIVIDNVMNKGAGVYLDAHDKGYLAVIHSERIPKNKRVKFHFIAAVNAVHGAVYIEFTTGTTNILRQYNGVPLEEGHGPYKVSHHHTSP